MGMMDLNEWNRTSDVDKTMQPGLHDFGMIFRPKFRAVSRFRGPLIGTYRCVDT